MIDRNSKFNPWTEEDEKEHFPCLMEWWSAEAFFTSKENNKKWSLKVAFTEWFENKKKQGSISNITLFDQDENKHYIFCKRDDLNRLKSEKNKFYVQFEDSFIKGAFPIYEMRFIDKNNDIELNIRYEAKSYPHWIAQDITNGWLPMGLGIYRYGFIPDNILTGTLRIKKKIYKIEGKGYFEHVWGDFDYDKPFNPANLKKTVITYIKLMGWRIKNRDIKIPNTIAFSLENNPFGYDWTWALFDNGWTMFYGNTMFWLMNGPGMGTIILTKDGRNYTEYNDFTFYYKKMKYADEYDFYYPTEFEIKIKKGLEKIHLNFKMTNTPREYISIFPYAKLHWVGLAICESPGIVKGYYYDNEKEIRLSGICKIEPQRQIAIFGHNKLKIDFQKPPDGIGIKIDIVSHFFLKKIKINLQLAPIPKINFKLVRINEKKINKNIK